MLLDMLNDLAEAMKALDGKKKSTEQEGKDCNDQDKQAQELVLGSFLAPEIEMILETELGPPCSRCWLVFYTGTAQLKKVLGWA